MLLCQEFFCLLCLPVIHFSEMACFSLFTSSLHCQNLRLMINCACRDVGCPPHPALGIFCREKIQAFTFFPAVDTLLDGGQDGINRPVEQGSISRQVDTAGIGGVRNIPGMDSRSSECEKKADPLTWSHSPPGCLQLLCSAGRWRR